jgi:hypothetical protein
MKPEWDERRLNEKPITDFLRSGTLYEPDVANLLLKARTEGDVVVDVGANIGFYTVLASILVGPTGRVVASEPGV